MPRRRRGGRRGRGAGRLAAACNNEESESPETEETPESPEDPPQVEEEPDRFYEEDVREQNVFAKGVDGALKKLLECAEAHLSNFVEAGPKHKEEKKGAMKKYHETAVEIVGAKLKSAMLPDIVKDVYKDLDIDRLANEEEDDEQFMKLLDEFGESAHAEAEKRWKEVTLDVIDKDPGYQDCLEALHRFRGSKPAKATRKSKVNDDDSIVSVGNTRASTTRHSEGLHALSEYIPTKDPITKRFFEDPYANSICGHVYEYATIMGMIGNGIKCPYPGCVNDEIISEAHLVKNLILEKKIKERIRIEMCDEIDE